VEDELQWMSDGTDVPKCGGVKAVNKIPIQLAVYNQILSTTRRYKRF
jgi:hypothetical protein